MKRGYDDAGQDMMKRPRYDDEAALGPDGKRLHTEMSAAIPGSETVYRLLVPAKKVGPWVLACDVTPRSGLSPHGSQTASAASGPSHGRYCQRPLSAI